MSDQHVDVPARITAPISARAAQINPWVPKSAANYTASAAIFGLCHIELDAISQAIAGDAALSFGAADAIDQARVLQNGVGSYVY